MPHLDDSFTHLPASGRIGLLELVHAKSPEAALAAAGITERAASEHGGRLEWAGHVDQLLFGDIDSGSAASEPNEILVSTYPSKKQALDVLSARREWGLDALVDAVRTFAYRAPGAIERGALRVATTALRLAGRKTPTADLSDPASIDFEPTLHGDPSLRPTEAALREYATCGIEGKVVMLNLLRYRRDAHGDETAGRAAYGRYGRVAGRLIVGLGGRIRVRGHGARMDGAGPATGWDELVCVEYPSRADFVGMITAPRYAPTTGDRDEGLERSALLVCTSHAKYF